MFRSCRNRLSMNSLRESIDNILDRDGGSAACYIELSSDDPPRLDVLHDLDATSPKHDGFRTSLEEAIQGITARGQSADYVNEADLRLNPRISKTTPTASKTADFRWATEMIKGITGEPCGKPLSAEKIVVDGDDLDSKGQGLSAENLGEAAKVRLKAGGCIRKAPEPRKGIRQLSDKESSGLSPSTARLVEDLGIQVDLSPSHSNADTVQLIYPWFQRTKGHLEVCPSHEAALNTLQATQLSRPVHDLAFYDAASRSYTLNPTCFLVDREVVDVAQARGINLVSLSRRRQALRGDDSARNLRPGELAMGAASVKMAYDEGYVAISIHRTHPNEVPVFVDADGEKTPIEVDGDAADGKLEP